MRRIHRITRSAGALVLAMVAIPDRADAQVHDVRAAVQYQLLHIPGTTFPAGVNADVSAIVRTPVAVIAEVGWAGKDIGVAGVSASARIINFGAGVRLIP